MSTKVMTATCRPIHISSIYCTALPVEIEVATIQGPPSFEVMGVTEREGADLARKVTAAFAAADMALPRKRIIVDVSVPRQGVTLDGGHELAVACAIAAEANLLPKQELEHQLVYGELTLGGEVRRPSELVRLAHRATDLADAQTSYSQGDLKGAKAQILNYHAVRELATKNGREPVLPDHVAKLAAYRDDAIDHWMGREGIRVEAPAPKAGEVRVTTYQGDPSVPALEVGTGMGTLLVRFSGDAGIYDGVGVDLVVGENELQLATIEVKEQEGVLHTLVWDGHDFDPVVEQGHDVAGATQWVGPNPPTPEDLRAKARAAKDEAGLRALVERRAKESLADMPRPPFKDLPTEPNRRR